MKISRVLPLCPIAAVTASAQAAPPAPVLVDKRIILAQFADCLARMGPGQSEALLRADPGSDVEHRAAETLVHAHSTCMTDRMVLSMNAPIIRGLVAEAMFKRRHPAWLATAEHLPASEPARPARPLQASVPTAGKDAAKRERAFMIAYSGCLAKAAPAQVAKVLETAIATPEEKDAVLGLGTNLNDCMPLGARYQLNVGGLRTNLASALYLDFARQPLHAESAQ